MVIMCQGSELNKIQGLIKINSDQITVREIILRLI